MAILCQAAPQLASVAYSGAGSCSSGIRVTATGTAYQGGGGLHVYIVIKGVDLEKLRRYLVVHLWINGLGYIAFARNGAMLERTVIDPTVLSPERLIYEANPVLGEGLTRRARQWQHRDGIPLSGDFNLTADQIAQYEQLTAAAKADPENRAKAEALADRYHEARVDTLAQHASISREEAATRIPKQTPAEREGREQLLQPDDVVEIQGKRLTVAELLAHGAEYDNLAMPDPVEGSEYGLTTAKFFYNNGISPCIHSFAHGLNTVYRLKTLDHRDGITGGNDYRLSGTNSGFDIDRAEPLDRSTFPNQKPGKGGEITLLSTIPNVAHLLAGYGITVQYDVIRKEMGIRVPGVQGTSDNYANVMIEYITSLAKLNGIPAGQIPGYVSAIADRNLINPVATWITSKPWDGIDRLPDVYATLVLREDFPAAERNPHPPLAAQCGGRGTPSHGLPDPGCIGAPGSAIAGQNQLVPSAHSR